MTFVARKYCSANACGKIIGNLRKNKTTLPVPLAAV
jgi:hypothetical protein